MAYVTASVQRYGRICGLFPAWPGIPQLFWWELLERPGLNGLIFDVGWKLTREVGEVLQYVNIYPDSNHGAVHRA